MRAACELPEHERPQAIKMVNAKLAKT
jgi:hypothetical protein